MSERLPWYIMQDESYSFDNEFEIPALDLAFQAPGIIGKFHIWGKHARKRPVPGDTYAFYSWDYTFTALIKHPEALIISECAAIVEPNFSTSDHMPLPVGLYGIFLKRKIARFAQTRGIRVIADLNVAPKFQAFNLLGLPQGWSAFAQRATKTIPTEEIKDSFELACDTLHPTVAPYCLVYGGGTQMRQICQEHHWIWVPEYMAGIRQQIAAKHE